MQIHVDVLDEWTLIKPNEQRLDARVAQAFKQSLTNAVSDGSKNIILDLGEVEFLDSSGLGALIFFKQFVGEGGNIVLAAVRPGVEAILKLTHLDNVFRIVESLDQVVEPTT